MNNYNRLISILLLILFILNNDSSTEARVMSGSITEKKQIAKVSKMLSSARKYVSKGKNQDAINTYWKILEINAYDPYAYLELGEIYKNLHIYDRAIEMLTSGLDYGKDEIDSDTLCKYYCVLTEVYVNNNQQGLANKSLIKATEIAPRNPLPRKILGDIYLNNNRVANAAKAYKKALELDPYYEPANKALNKLKSTYGDKLPKEDKDKEYIKKVAVKLLPNGESNNNSKKIDEIKSDNKENEKALSIKQPDINNEAEQQNTETKSDEISQIKDINDSKKDSETKDSIIISDSRPLPLEANEIAKMNKKKNNRKKQNKPTPKTAEEIEKAMREEENFHQSANEHEDINNNERYIDLFLSGNPTEKEEALNYFINQGKGGLSEIEELIYDSNPNVRILAIRALPLFDDYKNEVKSILQDASDDSDPEVIEEINKALNLL